MRVQSYKPYLAEGRVMFPSDHNRGLALAKSLTAALPGKPTSRSFVVCHQ